MIHRTVLMATPYNYTMAFVYKSSKEYLLYSIYVNEYR